MPVIIVGGGISGLYAAYKLVKSAGIPGKEITIYEKESKLGGRAETAYFAGSHVPLGAGIGRWKKDKLLRKLLVDLNVPFTRFKSITNYKFDAEPIDMYATLDKLGAAKEMRGRSFGEHVRKVLGPKDYNRFILTNGYTDDLKADATDAIRTYGHDDNAGALDAFSVPWKDLIEALSHVLRGAGVKIRKSKEFVDNGSHDADANVIIYATDVETLKAAFPDNAWFQNGIRGQSFIRVYATFKRGASELHKVVPSITHVTGPLQKIIPMGPKMFMIAYADNDDADVLKEPLETRNARFFELALESALKMAPNTLEIAGGPRGKYWKIGTHYRAPGFAYDKEPQKPAPRTFVIGEVVAKNQGWVEGALESFHAVENDIKKELQS